MGKADVLFKESGKTKKEDVEFIRTMDGEESENVVFIRAVARKIKFTRVSFRFCIFDNCYFRDCVFDSCDFTGCKFTGSNLNGSNFIDCKLNYSVFERTILDLSYVIDSLPREENLRAKVLRSLRTNFQQQGDASEVNKAMRLELEATKTHLKKCWHSSDKYYRNKYSDFIRIKKLTEWGIFSTLHFIWGNGESAIKLFRTFLIILAFISTWEIYNLPNANDFHLVIDCLLKSPSIFFSVDEGNNYSKGGTTLVLFLRLVVFGLFMSILIKKISRR